MATELQQTARVLNQDGGRGLFLLFLGSTLLAALWSFWSVLTEVPVYETAVAARVEVEQGRIPIEAPVSGQVVSVAFALGDKVDDGQLLLEIDASDLKILVSGQNALRSSLEEQIQYLDAEARRLREEHIEAQDKQKRAIDESEAEYEKAKIASRLAAAKLAADRQLRGEGLISEIAFAESEASARTMVAALNGVFSAMHRLRAEFQVLDKAYAAQTQRNERERSRLRGELDVAGESVHGLYNEEEMRHVRAPDAGLVAEVREIMPGAVVTQGERIGTILRPGGKRIVASFAADAISRIRPGQRAVFRADSYPWVQFGTLDAVVEAVAREVAEDSTVRVELSIGSEVQPRFPVEHGLPGSLEVEVERLTPLNLVLRAAGASVESQPFSK